MVAMINNCRLRVNESQTLGNILCHKPDVPLMPYRPNLLSRDRENKRAGSGSPRGGQRGGGNRGQCSGGLLRFLLALLRLLLCFRLFYGL